MFFKNSSASSNSSSKANAELIVFYVIGQFEFELEFVLEL